MSATDPKPRREGSYIIGSADGRSSLPPSVSATDPMTTETAEMFLRQRDEAIADRNAAQRLVNGWMSKVDEAIADRRYLDEQLSAMRAERDAARNQIARALEALKALDGLGPTPWQSRERIKRILTEGQEA